MNVLLIALGRMGQRYVTALQQAFGDSLNLTTVDPFVTDGVAESAQHYTDITDVPADIPFDLAIDARPNIDRPGMLKALVSRAIPYIILEKPSASSVAEIAEMEHFISSLGDKTPKVMVPFYRRFLPAYQPEALSQLDAGDLRHIHATSGAIGLGCNGVHLLDLANWLFGCHPISVSAMLQEDTVPSPRGEQFEDLGGSLLCRYPCGGQLSLTILANSMVGITQQFTYERGKILLTDTPPIQWQWFKQPKSETGEWESPIYHTHREQAVEPAEPYQMDLVGLMTTGINALVNNQPVPTLTDGAATLKTIAMAMAASRTGHTQHWDTCTDRIADTQFKFT